ncbi:MAG: Flagellar basal-body rod protein FlgC [Thermoleophilia bacterium]|nr:Flagellar basal-body rod protein FlgC [Thermoleophilia bacterium]
MGIFDALSVANNAMSVHRYRSEIAASNIANVQTPGYRRQEVVLNATDFASQLEGARIAPGGVIDTVTGPTLDAHQGAVGISQVRKVSGSKYDERQQSLLATSDMLRAKSAFELNVKSATLLKSMALAALEIGRGS